MSTLQGKIVVGLLAAGPPAALLLRTYLDPQYLASSSKTLILLSVIICAVILRNVTVPYFTSPLRHLPQPPGERLLTGHLLEEFAKPIGSTLRRWVDNVDNAGLIFYRGILHCFPRLLLTTPEALHEVLITHAYDYQKPSPGRILLSRTTGQGLVVVEGHEHKLQRKSVAPAFTGKQIKDLVPLFWSKSKEFVDVIANQLDVPSGLNQAGGRTGVVDLTKWTSRATLDIIGQACVGRDFASLYNQDDEFVQQYDKILGKVPGNILVYGALSVLIPIHIGRWVPFFTRFRQASDGRYHLRPLCRNLIEIKRRDMESESAKHVDILSVLIRSGQFTDDGLVDQLLTFLAAGHETTSGALSFTAWLLSINPSVQNKLRAELREYFAVNTDITAASLDQLPYLNAVTNEQLRLVPSVPTTARVAIRDTQILGQHVAAGTHIVISPWAINRSQKIWGPDAEEFRPERWLEQETSKSPLNLMTFLHGPRSCIGQAFSRAELKCLVAALVHKFELKMADPGEVIEPVGLATVKPKNGLRLLLREL
ncbi:related to cytochrome P450 monooxygenase [Ramularia collo-cygni]|uniref:Related to cytochrome P450 monooxygenase n=1 Tax=Ramularia collo-cygni TaxID=112498 RepID=A0A2D3UM36_9PEZI|nr:related to cytochrome P450 monooxygenase [Ramularia collo-cygni]CZT15982.1 related to cytochrome P450 monooxygenase [Ramularia collo-cygni]